MEGAAEALRTRVGLDGGAEGAREGSPKRFRQEGARPVPGCIFVGSCDVQCYLGGHLSKRSAPVTVGRCE